MSILLSFKHLVMYILFCKLQLYRGPDAVDVFVTNMQYELEIIKERLSNPTPIMMTMQDELNFKNATSCYLCHKLLGEYEKNVHL